MPEVNLWNTPEVSGELRVVGVLSGDGRKDHGLKCQGSVVRALEIKNVAGRTHIKIKTVVGSNTGWITDSFVGRSFKRSQCKTFFLDAESRAACLGQ